MLLRVPCVVVLLITQAGMPLSAQDSGSKQRRQDASNELQTLQQSADKLPKPSPPRRGALPVPYPETLVIERQILNHVTALADLPGAGAPALLLLARVRNVNCDPAGVLEALELARKATTDDAPLKRQALTTMAETQERWGDLRGAATTYTLLIQENPDDPNLSRWQDSLASAQTRGKHQEKELARVRNMLASTNRSDFMGSISSTQRFISRYPMHTESPALVQSLLKMAGDEKGLFRTSLLDLTAFYAPGGKNWIRAAREVLPQLVTEGEYERALFYAQKLLARSEDLKPARVQKITESSRDLVKRLKQVATRDLEISRKTKSRRYMDLTRRAVREDPEFIAELARDFVEDYPTCSEVAHVLFLGGQAMLSLDPEAGTKTLERIVTEHTSCPFALDALMLATRATEENSDAEKAEELLRRHVGKFPIPSALIALSLERVRLLSSMERWEDARDILQPLAGKTGNPAEQAEVEKALLEITKQLGGG